MIKALVVLVVIVVIFIGLMGWKSGSRDPYYEAANAPAPAGTANASPEFKYGIDRARYAPSSETATSSVQFTNAASAPATK